MPCITEEGPHDEVWKFTLMAADDTASGSSGGSSPSHEASVAWQSSRVARTSPSPFPRLMFSAVSLPYGSSGSGSGKQSQRLFLFGGVDAYSGEHCGDLWSLDLDQEPPLKWKQHLQGSASGAGPGSSTSSSLSAGAGSGSGTPPPRCNFAMAALPSEGLVLVHGGEAEGEAPPLNDLWVLAGAATSSASSSAGSGGSGSSGGGSTGSEFTPRWLEATSDAAAAAGAAGGAVTTSKVLVSGTPPTPRCSHGATWVADSRVVVFFGGVGTPAAVAEGAVVSAVDGIAAAAAPKSGPEGSSSAAEMYEDGVSAAESPLSKLSLADSPENDDEEGDDDDDYEDEEDEEEGESTLVPLNDVWILHLEGGSEGSLQHWRWSTLAPAFGLAPSPRSLPALASLPYRGQSTSASEASDGGTMTTSSSSSSVFVFGGYGLYEVASEDKEGEGEGEGGGEIRMGYLRDLWALDVTTGQWTCSDDLSPPGTDFTGASALTTTVQGGGGGGAAEELSTSSSSSLLPPFKSGSEVQARNGHGLLVLGGSGDSTGGGGGGGGLAVTFGGYAGTSFLNSVEVFRADWAEVGLRTPKDEEGEDDDEEEEEEEDEQEDEEHGDRGIEEMDEEEEDDDGDMIGDATAERAASGDEFSSSKVDGQEAGEEGDLNDENGAGEDNDDDEEETGLRLKHTLRVPVRMWEFGQNDPKRDSGSKLVRLGLAQTLKITDYFGGIVLNAEASAVVSPADAELLLSKGVGGVNCSWNRLKEVPSRKLGKTSNHRLLPYLLAANSVRYHLRLH